MAEKYDMNGLDQIDIKILAALQRSGRITKLQLSEEVGLSPAPCWERIKKLEKTGFIHSYHAQVDYKKILNISYFNVEITIKNYSLARANAFETTIKNINEIIECQAVLGKTDYILKVIARNVEEYQEIITRLQNESHIEIDFLTYPVSKFVKEPHKADLLKIYNNFSPSNVATNPSEGSQDV